MFPNDSRQPCGQINRFVQFWALFTPFGLLHSLWGLFHYFGSISYHLSLVLHLHNFELLNRLWRKKIFPNKSFVEIIMSQLGNDNKLKKLLAFYLLLINHFKLSFSLLECHVSAASECGWPCSLIFRQTVKMQNSCH